MTVQFPSMTPVAIMIGVPYALAIIALISIGHWNTVFWAFVVPLVIFMIWDDAKDWVATWKFNRELRKHLFSKGERNEL